MVDPAVEVDRIDAIAPARAVLWWVGGLRLWRRAPLRFALLCLIPLLIEAAVQMIPLAGIVLSKLLVAVVGAGAYVVMDGLSRSGAIRWSDLLWGFRSRNIRVALQIALIMLSIFVAQSVVAFALYGVAAIDAVVLGRIAAHAELMTRAFVLTLILPGIIPATLLVFAMPLAVLRGEKPIRAAWTSLGWFFAAPISFVLTCTITIALLGASLAWGHGLAMILVVPWISATGYAAYVDVFERRQA